MEDNTHLKDMDGRLLYSKDGTPITAKLYGDPQDLDLGKPYQAMIDEGLALIDKHMANNKK